MPLSPGQIASLACLLEAAAPKPGNVHRGADFQDLTFTDLAASAVVVGAAIDRTIPEGRVGRTILAAVQAMRAACDTNAYLGTILLIAPLAHAPPDRPLNEGVKIVLANLTAQDAADVYEAIRCAQPGGLDKNVEHDVGGDPPADLLVAMQHAADRDLVARQYVNGFHEIFQAAAPWIASARASGLSLTASIVHAHVRLMSVHPDSLIARKCGEPAAREAAARAAAVLESGPPESEPYLAALADLDFWLRSDGHRRNPGTTADLIAAALYVLVTEGRLQPPWK